MDVNSVYSNYNTTASGKTSSTSSAGADLDINDFFQLLAAQLQNQNMMDPVDNTQFIAQMAQFSSLSQMNELSSRVNTSFAVSLVGKMVTVMGEDGSGNALPITGLIEGVSFQNKVPYLQVNGKNFGLEDITAIKEVTKEDAAKAAEAKQAILEAEAAALGTPT